MLTGMTTANLILGALVADAAARGLHWLYDPARIAQIADEHGSAAFVPVDPDNYAGAKGVAVHARGTDGEQTQYGHALVLATRQMCSDGAFDVAAYQKAYAAHFGAGGAYTGYIDRPTRGTLANLAAEVSDPSGIEDDQHPALATLPAVVHAHYAQPDFEDVVMNAIRVTNVHEDADFYGLLVARLMRDVATGTPLASALKTHATNDLLRAALTSDEPDSVAYGEITSRACHLPQGVPLSYHILSRADSYRDAVERNIRAGGDSAGRALIVGSLAAAAYGVSGANGIPLQWLTATSAVAKVTNLLDV